MTTHDDGRAGAYVIVDTVENPEPVEVFYMVAAETEKGWKIDDILAFGPEGTVFA